MTTPDWRSLLSDDEFELRKPASAEALADAEAVLDTALPADLRALYLVSDGVYHRPGQWFVIWTLAKVVEFNGADWVGGEGEDRRQLVGFGDDGTGDPFCVPRDGNGGVLIWHPIEQEAVHLAGTLQEFWTGWCDGTITT